MAGWLVVITIVCCCKDTSTNNDNAKLHQYITCETTGITIELNMLDSILQDKELNELLNNNYNIEPADTLNAVQCDIFIKK